MNKWGKRSLIALLGLLAIPLVLTLIGLFLPQDHEVSVEGRLPVAPAIVWARIVDPVASADWRPGIERVERLDDRDGRACFREHMALGPVTYVHETLEPARRLVTRIVDERAYGGTWEFVLTPDGDGTRVEITERSEVYSPLFRALGLFTSWDVHIRAYLDDLSAVTSG